MAEQSPVVTVQVQGADLGLAASHVVVEMGLACAVQWTAAGDVVHDAVAARHGVVGVVIEVAGREPAHDQRADNLAHEIASALVRAVFHLLDWPHPAVVVASGLHSMVPQVVVHR